MNNQCSALCKNGKICTRNPINMQSDKCWQHGNRRMGAFAVLRAVPQVSRVERVTWRPKTPSECIKDRDLPGLIQVIELGRHSAETRDAHGETCLSQALRRNNIEFSWVCLRWMQNSLSADKLVLALNSRDSGGRQSTALHHAARHGLFDIVCKMVLLGAVRKREDGVGHYPEKFARNNGHTDVADFLSWRWYNKPWSKKIHRMTPVQFQREVWNCLATRLFKQQSRDVKFLIFDKLLTLHKLDYANQ